MALVNPNIAMSYRPTTEYQPRNALAEYAQIQQIMGNQRQAALADYQLEAAKRGERSAAIQNELYARHYNPETGGINATAFAAEAAQRGQGAILPAFFKSETERQAAAAGLEKTRGEIEANQFSLRQKRFKQAWENAGSADTPQLAIEQLTKAVRNGELDMASASPQINQLQNMTPEQYRQWRIDKIAQFLDNKDKIARMEPRIKFVDTGAGLTPIQDNPSLRGYGLPVAGMAQIAKTPTFGEVTAQGNLALAQQKFEWEKANPGNTLTTRDDGTLLAVNNRTGEARPVTMAELGTPVRGNDIAAQRLAFDRQKFAWERENPGFELKESADGAIYGVNKRTLQAFPVNIGGAAVAPTAAVPTAAVPVAPGAAQPTAPANAARSAGAPAPAAPAAAAPGEPLRGKGRELAVSEQQASYNLGRILAAATEINTALKKDPNALKPGAAEATAASAGAAGAANVARNAQRQIVYGAQRDALDAMLYLATGAAYNREQLEGQMAAYIPAFTDKAEAVDAKRLRMLGLIQTAKVRAGRAWTPAMDEAVKSLMQPEAGAGGAASAQPSSIRSQADAILKRN